MEKKIEITQRQVVQFNAMLGVLKRISKDYQSTSQLRKNSDKQWGLSYEESLEMSYENIQNEAATACKKVKQIFYNQPNK